MSNSKQAGIVMRDRRGVLYSVPPELAQKYVIDKDEFDSAAEFYKAEEDDVTGQTMFEDERFFDGLPEDSLINRPILKIRF